MVEPNRIQNEFFYRSIKQHRELLEDERRLSIGRRPLVELLNIHWKEDIHDAFHYLKPTAMHRLR
jgi:hypothetical protein